MKTVKIVVVLVVAGFLAGLLGGYTIWKPSGDGEEGLRDLLARVGAAAERIENRNRDLASRVEALQENATEAEALKAENRALKGQLDNAVAELQGRIAGLDNQVRDLTVQLGRKQREVAEREAQNGRLRAELAEARNQAAEGEKLQAQTDELRARISSLEQENREQRSVIDNISEMTKRREAPP